MPTAPTIDPQLLAKTHSAIFDTWFPLDELPILQSVKPEIAKIATKVSVGMLKAFSRSSLIAFSSGLYRLRCLLLMLLFLGSWKSSLSQIRKEDISTEAEHHDRAAVARGCLDSGLCGV